MSKVTKSTPWSTVLISTSYMPIKKHRNTRGIFLGYTKCGKFIRVIPKGQCTYGTYSPEFWRVDDKYMSDREKIAELLGRIAESSEPADIRRYRVEMEEIMKGIKAATGGKT
jgi:hypothetical protein